MAEGMLTEAEMTQRHRHQKIPALLQRQLMEAGDLEAESWVEGSPFSITHLI